MRFLPPGLRLLVVVFLTASPFPAAALLPGIVLIASYRGLVLAGAGLGVALTVAVLANSVVRMMPRLRGVSVKVQPLVGPVATWTILSLFISLPMAFLLWQMNPAYAQHFVTFNTLLPVIAHLIDLVDKQWTAAKYTWPDDLKSLWPALTRAMVAKGLAFALLNETLIRVASSEVWLLWCALIPLASHYVTSGLTATVMLDEDLHG